MNIKALFGLSLGLSWSLLVPCCRTKRGSGQEPSARASPSAVPAGSSAEMTQLVSAPPTTSAELSFLSAASRRNVQLGQKCKHQTPAEVIIFQSIRNQKRGCQMCTAISHKVGMFPLLPPFPAGTSKLVPSSATRVTSNPAAGGETHANSPSRGIMWKARHEWKMNESFMCGWEGRSIFKPENGLELVGNYRILQTKNKKNIY